MALIFLIALTVAGVVALEGNRLQQKMTYGTTESTLAFESAESALVDGEMWLQVQPAQPIADCTSTCPVHMSIWDHRTADALTLTNLDDPVWWTNNGRKYGWSYLTGQTPAQESGQQIGNVAQVPRYALEVLGKDPTGSLVLGQGRNYEIWFYLASATGAGAQNVHETVVQSVYAKDF